MRAPRTVRYSRDVGVSETRSPDRNGLQVCADFALVVGRKKPAWWRGLSLARFFYLGSYLGSLIACVLHCAKHSGESQNITIASRIASLSASVTGFDPGETFRSFSSSFLLKN
jgi:hypothetical protein